MKAQRAEQERLWRRERLRELRPTPANREIVFHSGFRKRKIVFQLCFTTRNLRTKLCGIRSQTEEQEFVDPFKSWYLETLSISEMENRRASPDPRLGGRSELKSGKFCTVLLGTHFYAFCFQKLCETKRDDVYYSCFTANHSLPKVDGLSQKRAFACGPSEDVQSKSGTLSLATW